MNREQKVLCCFNVSNNCPGWTAREDLYVDENGDTWDYCKVCAEHERVFADIKKYDDIGLED